MFANYFKTMFRNFRKNKAYGYLNVFGLAIGIACAGLIFLWVEDELTFDDSYAKKDLLYEVRTNQTYDGKTRTFTSTPGQLAAAVKTDVPGIADACRLGWGANPLLGYGDKSINAYGAY